MTEGFVKIIGTRKKPKKAQPIYIHDKGYEFTLTFNPKDLEPKVYRNE